jgi:hypothetical protein
MERFVPTLSERTTRYVLYLCGFLCFAIGGQSVFCPSIAGTVPAGRRFLLAGRSICLASCSSGWHTPKGDTAGYNFVADFGTPGC